LKICLISQNASPGFLIFRADFIRYLVAQGHRVYCFAIDYTEVTKKQVEALGGLAVDYNLNRSGMNPIVDLRDTWRLSKLLEKIAPNVAFSFFVKPSIYGTLAAKLAGVPRRVAMLEGLGYMHTPSMLGVSFKKRVLQRVHGLLCSLSYTFADRVLFLNPDDPVDLARVSFLNASKLTVLGPIGLDLNAYPTTPVDMSKPIRFIFIARLLAEKGVFEYFDAARLVKLKYPNAEFVVLGGLDPDNPAALSQSELAVAVDSGLIIYPGHVSNVSEWLADSHVFVLPSYREGLPRSTQEAMAMGRAVITTDVPGCRETVGDGVNGFLVPPWDAQLLAEKMLYFIEHPQEILRMGQESHRIAQARFDVHKINPVLTGIVMGEE
jgi:glycosyltransferase involved in cell wall biosynthesis